MDEVYFFAHGCPVVLVLLVENSSKFGGGLVFSHFPGGSNGKASAYSAGDPGSIPGSGR